MVRTINPSKVLNSVVTIPDPVSAGSLLTYTLTLTNTGPSNAALATITGTLPTELSFVSAVVTTPVYVQVAVVLRKREDRREPGR